VRRNGHQIRERFRSAVRRLIDSGEGLRASDVSGCFWLDVDTPEDLAYARRALRHRMAEASSALGGLAG